MGTLKQKRQIRLSVQRNSKNAELQRENFRQIADAARGSGDWAAAAFYYLEMLRENSQDGGIWMQHGHMLKELGLLSDAAKSYSMAAELLPSDPEVYLQIGFLSKRQGNFEKAVSYLNLALENNYKDPELIDRELRALHRVISPPPKSVGRHMGQASFRLLLSSIAKAPVNEDSAELRPHLGAAHYSYGFLMHGYVSALEALGLDHTVVQHPEYIYDAANRFGAGINLHIGFYPPEHLRLLKGAYNIQCLAWEFERMKLPSEVQSYQAFADPVKALARTDEIWCTCSFTNEVLQRHGLDNVQTVPSPVAVTKRRPRSGRPTWKELDTNADKLKRIRWVPLAIAPFAQGTLNQQARQRRCSLNDIMALEAGEEPPVIFLSIFNVADYRKQIRPMLEAFLQISARTRNCFLLLKVSVHGAGDEAINEIMLQEQLSDAGSLTPFFISSRVWMTCDVLSREEMNRLYDCAAFYVCTSHAEGQNLPLLEAMSRGAVPISVDHTAMRDYISTSNSVVIPSELRPFTLRLAKRYGQYGVSTYYVDGPAALRAFNSALDLDEAAYTRLSASARDTVAEKFNSDILGRAVDAAVERARRGDNA